MLGELGVSVCVHLCVCVCVCVNVSLYVLCMNAYVLV